MKSKILLLLVVVSFVSVGMTYSITKKSLNKASVSSGHTEAETAKEEPAGIKIAGLKIAPAVTGEGWDTITLTGKVNVPPDKLVKVSSRIDGKVVSIRGNVGDSVQRGQILAVISSVELAEARAQYRQARARLNAAQKNLDQEQRIAKLGMNSIRPLEEARTQSLESEGGLADAKSELLQAKSEQSQAESELFQCKSRLDRAKELYADKIVSRQDLETAEAEYKRDSSAVDAAKSKVNQAQTRIEKSKAQAEIAKQYLSRENQIFKGKVVDSRAVQSARADVTGAKIDVQAAADKIRVLGANPAGSGETIAVTSPISGRITARSANAGEMTTPSDSLFTIANFSQVWVEADVYEKDLAKVRKGQPVEIRVDAYQDKVFSGKVNFIGDILSAESKTAKVRCAIANPQGLLKGEMFAQVTLVTSTRGKTVLIPKQAILDDAGKKIVFTPCMECPEDLKAGTNACGAYDKFEVETGSVHGDRIEILKGIELGTDVVTVGQYQLKSALGSGQLEAGCSH